MAKVFIEESTLTNIGNAIREKTGKSDLIDPALMSEEIASIEAGGGDIPEEAFLITGNCSYRFAHDGWSWFIERYANKITTTGITTLLNAFYYSKELQLIPFTLNVSNAEAFARIFQSCENLRELPRIRGTIGKNPDFSDSLQDCYYVRNCDELFEVDMLAPFAQYKVTGAYNCPKWIKFYRCHSLRTLPSWWAPTMQLNQESTVYPAYNYGIYYSGFYGCSTLDAANDIPVWRCQAAQTSNMLGSMFQNTFRLKSITFETDNGQPIETQWKGQTLDLTQGVGYVNNYGDTYKKYITGYNSGITEDKFVYTDEQYQALKNDPDFTAYCPVNSSYAVKYSRYNHDSAVETINSLPDTSAYLASAGGTNTIKFTVNAGSNTDGGAIDTLTAEEIAVAAARGWTVTLA